MERAPLQSKLVFELKYNGAINKNNLPHGKGVKLFENGDKYDGEWIDGKRQGKGKLISQDKVIIYDGDWKNDKKEGVGMMKLNSGNEYVGEWKDDKKNGNGILRNKQGDVIFEGNWIDDFGYAGVLNSSGLPHGQGVGVDDKGDRYEGDWENGKREGKGTITFSEAGQKYVGDWKGDHPNGVGVLMDKFGKVIHRGRWLDFGVTYDGALNTKGEPHGKGISINHVTHRRYEGDWVEGKREGEGTLDETIMDGISIKRRYVGGWIDNKREGKGVESEFENVYEGEFKDGEKEGKGVETVVGDKYEGDFKRGKRDGKGVLTYKNGKKYVGEFVEGELKGKGVLMDSDGTVLFEGTWFHDMRYQGALNAEGVPHGKGVAEYFHIHEDGDRYEGDWVSGKREGKGTLEDTAGGAGRRRYTGDWVGDVKEGKGTETVYGETYEGEYKDGLREGKGTMIFKDGKKYVGEWTRNEQNGEGVLYGTDGTALFEGKWISGMRFKGPVNSGGQPHGKGVLIQEDGQVLEREWVDGVILGSF